MPRNGSGVYSLPPGSTFTPNTLIQSSVVNGINNDLATDLNTARPIVAGGTGATTAAGAIAALGGLPLAGGTMTGPINMGSNALTNTGDISMGYHALNNPGGLFLSGMLFGLTLANNALDAVNDIDIAAGSTASDSAVPTLITLASGITKRLDAAWAVGSGNGGLDTGSIANTTYHVWLIQRSDTGVVDALFSTSATSPTMPTNYDRKRRIGSILREAAAIVAFTQDGDIFRRAVKVDRSSTSALASSLLTLSVPTGIPVYPILQSALTTSQLSSSAQNLFASAFEGSATLEVQAVLTGGGDSADTARGWIPPIFLTNTSAQLYFACNISSGTIAANVLNTCGWIDRRGRM
jgi:hypothetical protein